MAGKGPSILVVADGWDERVLIAATLREAGFAVIAATDGRDAMAVLRPQIAAAVIALADDDGVALVRELRHARPGLPALRVIDRAALHAVEEDCATLVRRPFDPRQLLGCVFELVLREEEADGAVRHSHAAELGIAAAQLACLCNRRATAAANGASRLAQDLTRQIGAMHSAYRGLAVALC